MQSSLELVTSRDNVLKGVPQPQVCWKFIRSRDMGNSPSSSGDHSESFAAKMRHHMPDARDHQSGAGAENLAHARFQRESDLKFGDSRNSEARDRRMFCEAVDKNYNRSDCFHIDGSSPRINGQLSSDNKFKPTEGECQGSKEEYFDLPQPLKHGCSKKLTEIDRTHQNSSFEQGVSVGISSKAFSESQATSLTLRDATAKDIIDVSVSEPLIEFKQENKNDLQRFPVFKENLESSSANVSPEKLSSQFFSEGTECPIREKIEKTNCEQNGQDCSVNESFSDHEIILDSEKVNEKSSVDDLCQNTEDFPFVLSSEKFEQPVSGGFLPDTLPPTCFHADVMNHNSEDMRISEKTTDFVSNKTPKAFDGFRGLLNKPDCDSPAKPDSARSDGNSQINDTANFTENSGSILNEPVVSDHLTNEIKNGIESVDENNIEKYCGHYNYVTHEQDYYSEPRIWLDESDSLLPECKENDPLDSLDRNINDDNGIDCFTDPRTFRKEVNNFLPNIKLEDSLLKPNDHSVADRPNSSCTLENSLFDSLEVTTEQFLKDEEEMQKLFDSEESDLNDKMPSNMITFGDLKKVMDSNAQVNGMNLLHETKVFPDLNGYSKESVENGASVDSHPISSETGSVKSITKEIPDKCPGNAFSDGSTIPESFHEPKPDEASISLDGQNRENNLIVKTMEEQKASPPTSSRLIAAPKSAEKASFEGQDGGLVAATNPFVTVLDENKRMKTSEQPHLIFEKVCEKGKATKVVPPRIEIIPPLSPEESVFQIPVNSENPKLPRDISHPPDKMEKILKKELKNPSGLKKQFACEEASAVTSCNSSRDLHLKTNCSHKLPRTVHYTEGQSLSIDHDIVGGDKGISFFDVDSENLNENDVFRFDVWKLTEKNESINKIPSQTVMCPSACKEAVSKEKMNDIEAQALETLAAQEDRFMKQLQEKQSYINQLQNSLEELKAAKQNNNRSVEEYEKSLTLYVEQISELQRKLEKSEGDRTALITERDQALEDLRNVESAFSDLHRKYERAKGALENMKRNEEIFIQRDQEMTIKVQNREAKLAALKDEVQRNLESMHGDYEGRIKDVESENQRLRAQFRKLEMKLKTLENDVEQKARENSQLSALCDELINGK